MVCDTGPLIALTLIGELELLHRLYTRVVAPRAVIDEATAAADLPGAGEQPA